MACGRDSGGDAPTEQGEAIEDGKATGTIEVWAMGTEGEVLGDFAAAFTEENPDAKVEVTAVPWESAHEKIANAIAAGETPDVTLVGTTWMGEFAQSGGLDPLPEDLVSSGDFFEGAWGSTEVGGTSYGVPWYVETRVLYYRKDLAAEGRLGRGPQPRGTTSSSSPSTCRRRAAPSTASSCRPAAPARGRPMLPFAWSNGAGVTNEDGTEYTIDSPEMVEALEYYKSYFDEGISPTRMLDAGELESGFADGTYGSFISGPWHTGLVEEQGVSEDEYAVAVLPGVDGARRHVVRRRWRPRGLRRLRQQGERLEVRPVARRPRDPAGLLRRGGRPARRLGRRGTPASCPRTRS